MNIAFERPEVKSRIKKKNWPFFLKEFIIILDWVFIAIILMLCERKLMTVEDDCPLGMMGKEEVGQADQIKGGRGEV